MNKKYGFFLFAFVMALIVYFIYKSINIFGGSGDDYVAVISGDTNLESQAINSNEDIKSIVVSTGDLISGNVLSGDSFSGVALEMITGTDSMNSGEINQVIPNINNIKSKITGVNKYTLNGELSKKYDKIEITWTHEGTVSKSYELSKYKKGAKSFTYNASDILGNLAQGENIYVIKGYEAGQVKDQVEYSLNIDKILSKTDYCNENGCIDINKDLEIQDNHDGSYKIIQRQSTDRLEYSSNTNKLVRYSSFYPDTMFYGDISVK